MSTLYNYIYSWFSNENSEIKVPETSQIIETKATPARNMPNVPKSQVVVFSPADRKAILDAKSNLRHINPPTRQIDYPPDSPLLVQLLEVTKCRRGD